MIAFLGMYDLPELHAANDALWAGMREILTFGPARLERDRDAWSVWTDPDLLFAQTCGYPFRVRLHRQTTLVATPDHGLDGCAPGQYRSLLVARPGTGDKLGGVRLAYNDALSQSGWAAPIGHLLALGQAPGSVTETGSHEASARAVASGTADLAGIDAVTWRLLLAYRPELASRLCVIGATAPSPGLPFVTARPEHLPALRAALRLAIAKLDPRHREALGLRGIVQVPAASYLAVPMPPPPSDFG